MVSNEHGGDLARLSQDFPLATQPWVDLSTGINPWSYPLPAPHNHHRELANSVQRNECGESMASAFSCEGRNVLPTAGSELIIRLLPLLLEGMELVVSPPTYGDYRYSWESKKLAVNAVSDIAEFARRQTSQGIGATQPYVYIVCNPNNPDGRTVDLQELQELLGLVTSSKGWLIVDEAYVETTPERSMSLMAGHPNLLILRSFGKFYGLPGLRLGAILGPEKILNKLTELLGFWSVSALALTTGTLAYSDTAWSMAMREKLNEHAERLDNLLQARGYKVLGSVPLFRLIESLKPEKTWQGMMEQGVYVRKFREYPSHLRIGLPADDNSRQRLETSLGNLLD